MADRSPRARLSLKSTVLYLTVPGLRCADKDGTGISVQARDGGRSDESRQQGRGPSHIDEKAAIHLPYLTKVGR